MLASGAFPVRTNPSIVVLFLLTERLYSNYKELQTAAQEHVKAAGWALVIGSGNKNNAGREIRFSIYKHNGTLDT